MFYFTNKVFHDLRIVAVKDGCGEPANVELDVSFSRFNVLLVADVHRLAPVSRQRDANWTCACKRWLSANTDRLKQMRSIICSPKRFPWFWFTFLFCPPLCVITVPNLGMCLFFVFKGGKYELKLAQRVCCNTSKERRNCFCLYLNDVMGSSVRTSPPQP